MTPMGAWVLSIPGMRNIKARCRFGEGEKTGKFGVYTL